MKLGNSESFSHRTLRVGGTCVFKICYQKTFSWCPLITCSVVLLSIIIRHCNKRVIAFGWRRPANNGDVVPFFFNSECFPWCREVVLCFLLLCSKCPRNRSLHGQFPSWPVRTSLKSWELHLLTGPFREVPVEFGNYISKCVLISFQGIDSGWNTRN